MGPYGRASTPESVLWPGCSDQAKSAAWKAPSSSTGGGGGAKRPGGGGPSEGAQAESALRSAAAARIRTRSAMGAAYRPLRRNRAREAGATSKSDASDLVDRKQQQAGQQDQRPDGC